MLGGIPVALVGASRRTQRRPAVVTPVTNTNKPLWCHMGNNYFDGFGVYNSATQTGDFSTLWVSRLAQAPLIWGVDTPTAIANGAFLIPVNPANTPYANVGAWVQDTISQQAANRPDVDTDHGRYVNCMESREDETFKSLVFARCVNVTNPSYNWTNGTGNRGLTAFLIDQAGAVKITPFGYAINITSNSPIVPGNPALPDGDPAKLDRHITEFTADFYYDNCFGKTGQSSLGNMINFFPAPDNCFGFPPVNGPTWGANADWRNSGTNVANNNVQTYTWNDGRTEVVNRQWLRGTLRFYQRLRDRAAADGRPMKITPNFELGSLIVGQGTSGQTLVDSIMANCAEWGIVEGSYGGPWRASNNLAPTWGDEWQNQPAGSPSTAFQNGTRFWQTTARLRALRDLVASERRIAPGNYANVAGTGWETNQNNIAEMRYIMTACWLSDGFYGMFNAEANSSKITGPIVWDECMQPLGIPAEVEPTAVWSNGVARRIYTNGVVLCNTTTSSQTVDPTTIGSGLWKRFSGSQSSSVNNGANVTGTITIGPKDGILLLKQ